MTVVVVEGIEVGKLSGVGENGATEMATARSRANEIDTITTADATDELSGIEVWSHGTIFLPCTLVPVSISSPFHRAVLVLWAGNFTITFRFSIDYKE